jgi:hypothetical protein
MNTILNYIQILAAGSDLSAQSIDYLPTIMTRVFSWTAGQAAVCCLPFTVRCVCLLSVCCLLSAAHCHEASLLLDGGVRSGTPTFLYQKHTKLFLRYLRHHGKFLSC